MCINLTQALKLSLFCNYCMHNFNLQLKMFFLNFIPPFSMQRKLINALEKLLENVPENYRQKIKIHFYKLLFFILKTFYEISND